MSLANKTITDAVTARCRLLGVTAAVLGPSVGATRQAAYKWFDGVVASDVFIPKLRGIYDGIHDMTVTTYMDAYGCVFGELTSSELRNYFIGLAQSSIDR